jgi:hypothetical protein
MSILNKVINQKQGYAPPLSKDECTLLLLILQETTFKGKDIQTLYELIKKLEEMLQFYDE